jgi:exopolysaccharide biosynthesis polyprenyl glycosylphosphotransferase
LIGSDLGLFFALKAAIGVVRAGILGGGATDVVVTVFPTGLLREWQFATALVLSLFIAGAYGSGDKRRDTGRVLAGVALATLLALYASAWETSLAIVVAQYLGVVAVLAPSLVATRSVVDLVVRRVRSRVGVARTVLVTHADADLAQLVELFDRPTEFVLVRRVELRNGVSAGIDPQLFELGSLIDDKHAETVLLWGDLSEAEFAVAVDLALASGCRLLSGPRKTAAEGVEPKAVWIDGKPLIELTAPSLRAWQLAVKRVLDFTVAMASITLLFPLLALIAFWVKLDSKGPVLFRHRRLGARGESFECYKFRSMHQDAERVLCSDPDLFRLYRDNDYKLPPERDPRLTRSGRFLRRTSLDELPQLFNVLMGRMSLVGPRPIVPDELEHYGGGAPLFLSLKPGITGAWAVNGRSQVGYPDRARMELGYIRRWTLVGDLWILLRTVPAVLRRQGAH